MTTDPYTTGAVDWIGENPGMHLKADPDGGWTSLLCFFRFVDSDEAHGTVNGRRLPGGVVPRHVVGRESRSALSETWIRR